MTTATTLCTTSSGHPRPLAGDLSLYARQAQIRAIVRQRLGEQHAHLLAEPLPGPGDSRICWSTRAGGIVRRLSALPAAVRDSVRTECDALLADIKQAGAVLETSGTPDAQLAGKLLLAAARRPGDEHLFLVGNQPVLVLWGCEQADLEPSAAPIAPTSPVAAVTGSDIAAPVVNPRARWLLPAPPEDSRAGGSSALALRAGAVACVAPSRHCVPG